MTGKRPQPEHNSLFAPFSHRRMLAATLKSDEKTPGL
jgi:hypothetical protein